jgi:hypothetical protein
VSRELRALQRPPSWVCTEAAARCLGMSAPALRKALDRRATRAPDGGIVAEMDGVMARKLGRLWRVFLGPWQVGLALGGERSDSSSVAKPDGSGKGPSP